MFPMSGVGFMGRKKGGPITSGLITLEFDDIVNAPVADPTDVADWNTLFNLPTLGTPFSSVNVSGNIVELIGGANIILKTNIFSPTLTDETYLIKFIDTDCVVTVQLNSHFRRQKALTHVVMPTCDIVGVGMFSGAASIEVCDFPIATTIGSTAFSGCTFAPSTSLSFPLVTEIGNSCFNMDLVTTETSLIGIDLPSCTTFTVASHFRNRRGLTSVNCPLVTSTNASFRQCTALVTLSLPSCTDFGTLTVNACSSLTTLTINAATTIGNSAVQNCTSLSSFSANSCLIIGSNAFENTPLLASVSLPVCTTIEAVAFIIAANNATMTSFSAPNCTTLNGSQHLRRRTGLTSINLAACTQLGATTANNNIFLGISGNTITFTLPVGTRTDGDAVALASANTVTFLP